PDRCCGKRISARPSIAVRSAIALAIGSTCPSCPGFRCSCSRSTNEENCDASRPSAVSPRAPLSVRVTAAFLLGIVTVAPPSLALAQGPAKGTEFSTPQRPEALLNYGNWSRKGSKHVEDQLPVPSRIEMRPMWRLKRDIEANLESRKTF